jgi:hypothetical protein
VASEAAFWDSGAQMDDLGAGFWFKAAGIFVLGAIVLFVVLIFLLKAIYAWGFLAAFLVLAVIALIFGWYTDRRNAGARSD